jgi:hypothetical protein
MAAIAAGLTDSASLHWGLPYPQLGDQGAPARRSRRLALYPEWYRPVRSRIVDLLRLTDNWDGRGARRICERDLVEALEFMASVMQFDTLAPWIGPLSSGGLQLVWRQGDVEVEAVFDSARGERELIVAVGDREWDEPAERGASLFATVVDRLSTESHVSA